MSGKNTKGFWPLVLLCSAVYFFSYLTRKNFAAVMVEIVAAENMSKVLISFAVTGLFITYGVGQLISGYLGDKMKPQLLMFIGLCVCVLTNLLIPFCTTEAMMTVVWSINGLAQAMIWPPLTRILATKLTEDEYKRAVVWVSCGGTIGNIAIFLLAPVLIHVSGWKLVFFVCGGATCVMALVWLVGYNRLAKLMPNLLSEAAPAQQGDGSAKKSGGLKMLPWGMLSVLMVTITMQGMLRDGIDSWAPSLLTESLNLATETSILSSVFLPLFGVAAIQLTSFLNRKWLKNEMLCTGVLFMFSAVSLLVLRLFGSSAVVAVVTLTLASGLSHGINLIQTCNIPRYFAGCGKTSFMSGLLNSSTYLGSALATYGVAAISESYGWNTTVTLWVVVAAIGMVLSLGLIRKWTQLPSYVQQMAGGSTEEKSAD